MRDRYVLQILMVTAGFGLLLGVMGVIDTPNDQSQPVRETMAKPVESASHLADFRDECNLPFGADAGAEETEPLAKTDCDKAVAAHRGLRTE